jgi:Spy/CpxP family protein refolding chaperone
MKKTLGLLALTLTTLAVAQDATTNAPPRAQQRQPRTPQTSTNRPTPVRPIQVDGVAEEMSLVTFLLRPRTMEQLELTQEQRAAITNDLKKIDVQTAELQKGMAEAIQKQAELIKLDKPDHDDVMKAVDDVWALRGNLAKLQTQRILSVKNHLTSEQQKRALELMQESRPASRARTPQQQQPAE